MAGFVVRLTLGDEQFLLDKVSVQEVDRVTGWTSYKNKREWFAALQREEPKAQIAAYIIAKARDGVTVRWSEVDFPDDVQACWVDESGREVEPLLEENEDGTLKTDADGMPLPVLRDGQPVWVFSDTREEVPPTTREDGSSPTSDTPSVSGSDGAIESSTTTSEPVLTTTS